MGCDIHTFGEVKIKDNWESLDLWKNNFEYESLGVFMEVPWDAHIYSGRNYTLFSALCGVRCYGENEGLKRLNSEPNGIPDDMSEILDDFIFTESDGHSFCHNTLKELKEFDFSGWDFAHQSCSEVVDGIIKELEERVKWVEGVTDEDVRLVYYFDN